MTPADSNGLERYLSQRALFWLATIISLGFSFGGIVWALLLKTHPGALAERGGAIGSAIAFLTLFAGRNYGERLFRDTLLQRPQLRDNLIKLVEGVPLPKEDSDWLLYALTSRQILGAEEQKLQNYFLVGASIFSTIIWGFGGLIVSCLLAL